MNIIYLLFASTLLTALVSWHREQDDRFVSAWSDGHIRISLFEEAPGSKWSHRLIIEKDGATIRKWGSWENGVFKGAVMGAMPNSFSGSAELASVPGPRGLLTCHELAAHGISPDTTLYWERQSSSVRSKKGASQVANLDLPRYPEATSRSL